MQVRYCVLNENNSLASWSLHHLFSFHEMLFAFFRSLKFEHRNIQRIATLSSISESLFFDLPQRLTLIGLFYHVFLSERFNLQQEVRRKM